MGLISTVVHSWDSCLPTITKGLVAVATFFFVFFQYMHSESHSYIDIVQYSHLSPFAEDSPWGAEPRLKLGPALQQDRALPTELRSTLTELRCTMLNYAASY
jgi:hypothetical protein